MSIREAVEAAGVVGCGGAGFPAAEKLAGRAEILLANGSECEPLLRSDYWTMARRPDAVLRGALLAAEACGARRVIIGIKDKHSDLLDLFEQEARGRAEVKALRDVYPAGDEHMLTHELTGRVPPHGGLPLHVGVLVHNVVTLAQIADAVDEKTPVTSRPVTIAGAVDKPIVLEAPLGTPLSLLLESAGGATISEFAALEGGAMMGARAGPDEPVKKTSSGFLILPPDNPAVTDAAMDIERIALIARSVCDQCYYCTEMCPRRLLGHAIEPHKIMRQIAFDLEISLQATSFPHYCCECGACSLYACPQSISPRRVIQWLKSRTAPPEPRQVESFRPALAINQSVMIPSSRLIARLGLSGYDGKAQYVEEPLRPPRVRIALRQGYGEPADPVVEAGDRVSRGRQIARRRPDSLGANLHASIDGTVISVDNEITIEA